MIVKMSNIVKKYGSLTALDRFNLQVKEGEIFGLLGPNGSGKTTAINCMLSLLEFEEGEVEIFNEPMRTTSYDIKRQIGIVLQNVAVFDELTVYQNIDYFCGLYVIDKKERKKLVQEAIEFVGLEDFVKFIPKKLSGGLLRRLNIACGIAHKPKLIILDEPTVAVDPQSRNKILEGIVKLNQKGSTIIYTSHYMEEVEQICTKIAVMDKGKIVALGTKEQLKASIELGEKIMVVMDDITPKLIEDIKLLPNVALVTKENGGLLIKFKGGNNLKQILEFLHQNNLEYETISSQMPTLNDVFLEITGKKLRD